MPINVLGLKPFHLKNERTILFKNGYTAKIKYTTSAGARNVNPVSVVLLLSQPKEDVCFNILSTPSFCLKV